ncbi:MAG: hypothetical protein ACYTG0_29805 [Planctomycetota bacterium]|jgi:hypothetical protein
MQPDHEADDLQALLHEEYGAPQLDDQFSADLIGRLQAEAAPSSTPTRIRRSPLAICLGAAAVAALVIAVIWISNPGPPGTNHEVAHRAKTDSAALARPVESTEIEESVRNHSVNNMSVMSVVTDNNRTEELSQTRESGESLLSEARESQLSEAEESESSQTGESESSQISEYSVIPNHHKQWRNISAMAAHADMLYVVDSDQLYEVSPIDGSRRIVGDDDWQNSAAMGAARGHLYIVSDNHLYEVSPTTGARRSLGKPDWAETKAIVTVGDKLYIVAGGLLQRVNPSDGSHEVLRNKNDSTNDPRKPKH